MTVPEASYWLIGDNWGGSDDSRLFGFFRADSLVSRVLGRIQTLSDLGGVDGRPRLVAVADPPA